jgi:hypothetical protein
MRAHCASDKRHTVKSLPIASLAYARTTSNHSPRAVQGPTANWSNPNALLHLYLTVALKHSHNSPCGGQ